MTVAELKRQAELIGRLSTNICLSPAVVAVLCEVVEAWLEDNGQYPLEEHRAGRIGDEEWCETCQVWPWPCLPGQLHAALEGQK